MIDTHTHLDDKRLRDSAEEIISGFDSDGLEFVINNSSNYRTMTDSFALARANKAVYTTVGCHPHDAKTFNADFLAKMTEYSTHKKVVAVGEIGLDYFHNFSPPDVQKAVFAEQIRIAAKLNLPLTVHVRDAFGDAFEILHAEKHNLTEGGVMHCFSGSIEAAREFLHLGFYIAFGGAITFKNAKKGDIIASVPIERVLAETDCPYQTPEPFRGQTNEPKNIKYVIQKLAAVYGKSFEEMEKILRENTLRLFKKISV